MSIAVYLAGPVDGTNDPTGWREKLGEFSPDEVLLYSPPHAFMNPCKTNAQALMAVNFAVIDICAGMIANLSVPGRAFGTIREIEYAINRGSPHISIVGDVSESLYAAGLCQFDTPEEALTHIVEKYMAAREHHEKMANAFGFLGHIIPRPDVDDNDAA